MQTIRSRRMPADRNETPYRLHAVCKIPRVSLRGRLRVCIVQLILAPHLGLDPPAELMDEVSATAMLEIPRLVL